MRRRPTHTTHHLLLSRHPSIACELAKPQQDNRSAPHAPPSSPRFSSLLPPAPMAAPNPFDMSALAGALDVSAAGQIEGGADDERVGSHRRPFLFLPFSLPRAHAGLLRDAACVPRPWTSRHAADQSSRARALRALSMDVCGGGGGGDALAVAAQRRRPASLSTTHLQTPSSASGALAVPPRDAAPTHLPPSLTRPSSPLLSQPAAAKNDSPTPFAKWPPSWPTIRRLPN